MSGTRRRSAVRRVRCCEVRYQGDKKITVWITGDSERAQQPAGVEQVIPMENGAGSKVRVDW